MKTQIRDIEIVQGHGTVLWFPHVGLVTVGRGLRMHLRSHLGAPLVRAVLTHDGPPNALLEFADGGIRGVLGATVSTAWDLGGHAARRWVYSVESYSLTDPDDVLVTDAGIAYIRANPTDESSVELSPGMPSYESFAVLYDRVQSLTSDQQARARSNIGVTGGGGGGATTHGELSGRDAAESHPIGAITGLQAALDGKEATGAAATAVAAHVGDADPHPEYTTTAEAAAAAPVQSVAGRTGAVTIAAADITDSTATGRSILAAADAAAVRTAAALGGAAVLNVGTTAGTVAAGDAAPNPHTHPLSDLQQSGATSGQVPEWSGSAWVPATPAGGSTNTRWVGAGELIPRVSAGAGIDGAELATNKINMDYIAFDAGAAEYAQVAFAWPDGFTTFTATFHWTAASGSGGVRWQASARCYVDDDALDQAQGTAQAVSDAFIAGNDAHKSAATAAITPAGTVASGNLCIVEISRAPSHGDDTLAVDALLIGCMLVFAS